MRKTTLWPLCYIFSNGDHVFRRIINIHNVLCRIPQGTFIPSLRPIGQVVSEEKSFEKLFNDDDDGRQVMAIKIQYTCGINIVQLQQQFKTFLMQCLSNKWQTDEFIDTRHQVCPLVHPFIRLSGKSVFLTFLRHSCR